MLMKIRLRAAIILRPPDVLRAEEPGAVHIWGGPDWNVEGHVLAAISAWIPSPCPSDFITGIAGEEWIPSAGISAVEVVSRDNLRQACLAEQRQHPDSLIRDVDASVSAVTEEGNEPTRAVESMGAVILRSANDLGERILRTHRKALELERGQPGVHRSDRGRDLR